MIYYKTNMERIKMNKSYGKKFFVLGVLALLLTLAFTPATQAEDDRDFTEVKEKLFNIEIEEFKADGSIEKKVFEITQNEINKLKNELLSTESIEERLLVLKKYNLIPQDKAVEELETGMYEKADRFGITPDDAPQKTKLKLPILLQFFKKVSATYFGGISLNFGLKFIIRIINLLPFINLPTLDFADFCGGLFGVLTTEGLIFKNNHTLITFPGISGMFGFVGYRIKLPFLMHIYTGFSAVTFGVGLGLHIKD